MIGMKPFVVACSSNPVTYNFRLAAFPLMKTISAYLSSRKRLTLALAVIWTAVIFIGCSLPGREIPKLGLFDNIDKLVHFLFFAGFFALWYLFSNQSMTSLLFILALAILYGFGLEYYQLYCVAGRSFDVWDGVADTLGALGGMGLVRWGSRK